MIEPTSVTMTPDKADHGAFLDTGDHHWEAAGNEHHHIPELELGPPISRLSAGLRGTLLDDPLLRDLLH
jgi:hypothetical protein